MKHSVTAVNRPGFGSTPAEPAPPTNGLAIAGFVCALATVTFFWAPGINFALWVLGVVFSAIGLKRANKLHAPYRSLAIAGLVIVLLPGTLLVFVIFLIVMVALAAL